MMENLQALLLQTEKQQDEKRRQEAEETEKWQGLPKMCIRDRLPIETIEKDTE